MVSGTHWGSTDVTSGGGGCYDATIGDEWVLAMAPQGGVVAAIGARAMAAELGTDQPLRSIHGVFASPVPHGPVVAEVQVLRRGRSMSQAQVTVRGPDAASGFTAVAVFGAERPGFTFTDAAPPVVPPPEECPSYRDPPPPESGWEPRPPFAFWSEVLDGRPALGHAPWDDSPRGAAEVATWFKFEQPPLGPDGGFDPLALLVAGDMMPSAVFEKVGFDPDRRWFAPSIDLTLHLFGTPRPGWILVHNRAHHAGEGYAAAENLLWDPSGPDGPELVGWASQQMFFTTLD
jgi:acyl-CoA thioesterase